MASTIALDQFGPDDGGVLANIVEASTTGVANVIDAVGRAKQHGVRDAVIMAVVGMVCTGLVVVAVLLYLGL